MNTVARIAVVGLFGLCVSAAAETIKSNVNDFVAPVIYGRTSVSAPQAGLILFDSQADKFYGSDASGNWLLFGTPGGYVQSTAASVTYSSISGCTNDVLCDLASITLTAGEWDISGQAVYGSVGGATTTTELDLGISASSGTTYNMTFGDNQVVGSKNNTSGYYDTLVVAPYRVILTASTPYYLKSYAATSVTNLAVSYRISARQVN